MIGFAPSAGGRKYYEKGQFFVVVKLVHENEPINVSIENKLYLAMGITLARRSDLIATRKCTCTCMHIRTLYIDF